MKHTCLTYPKQHCRACTQRVAKQLGYKPKKRWCVKFEDSDIREYWLFIYINAISVKKTSHDRVVADGIFIDLPGNIKSVKVNL